MCKIYLCIFSAFEDSETVYTDDISLYGMLIKVLSIFLQYIKVCFLTTCLALNITFCCLLTH